ncbi:hypothetical protein Ddye_027067 [Dipteronia dyeriana]|uniref:Uncharacterized protein n=1 Tax=Dipteronia dyeriana TaxID=168575 RepID=A0AAD9WR12_9ROSI|nr:hypothetical protein Ddye_027067 [Dipteronia dyeriana]
MATDHQQQHKYNNPMSYNIALDHETKPDRDLGSKDKERKANKRGSSSSSTQKKKPQRGMGVAQLEKLRLQEGFKKMTEIPPPPPPPPPSNLNLQAQFHHYQYYSNNHHHHFPLPEPIPSVPVMYAAGHYGVPSAASAVGYGGGFMMMGLDQGLVYQRHGNGGSGHFSMDPYRVVVGGSFSGTVETSKELSSIPKLQPQQQQQCAVVPERCDCCSKKKRFNGDNRIGSFNGGKVKYVDQFSQVVNINGYDHHQIPGVLKQENNFINGGLIDSSFGARAARSALYSGQHNINEGLEVVAVHRNGKSSVGKNVVMEYEFFPAGKGSSGGRSRSTSSKELGLSTHAEASVAVGGGEASYFTTSAYNNNSNNNLRAASNSIDLSLKLSY